MPWGSLMTGCVPQGEKSALSPSSPHLSLPILRLGYHLPTQVGAETFHWANAPGTGRHSISGDP